MGLRRFLTAIDQTPMPSEKRNRILPLAFVGHVYPSSWQMFWSPTISIIPGTDEKLGIHGIGREIMETRFAIALY